MPVTTVSAAVHITPVVIKTFLKHTKNKARRLKASQEDSIPQDDIFFDEAFNIVKAFIELGTKNTVESLQAFTNTHVPAPYWALVRPIVVPFSSCNEAADALIEWFGPDELKYVVGGERWWQVRGLNGVDAEWVAEQQDVGPNHKTHPTTGAKLKSAEADIVRLEKLDKVMYYIHGGGYFWGSINTHRYQILHYAQKFKGRAFTVNYRKAPQYPWPCALQDVLAGYLYLIHPPPEAFHKPVPPSKIVLAGDSAGGGLCLTLLTILRDLELPMPAGAVLISPWVDLTHSFPSVMQNTPTDIIPQYGFLAKPSTLWPLPTKPENGGRVVKTVSNEPPEPGKAEPLDPELALHNRKKQDNDDVYGPGKPVKSQQEMLDSSGQTPSSSNPVTPDDNEGLEDEDLDLYEPKPPKVLMENPNATPLELRSQIQLYASTEQLTHPLVSPILQGSLGNLPPLYILGGDGEVLRDEIIYLAHKAAHPEQYPARSGILRSGRQKENSKKFTKPTKVHLQIFDGMCHVLTVFMFTQTASYAYRSIAEFVNHVTKYDEAHLERNPFPELHQPPEVIPGVGDNVAGRGDEKESRQLQKKSHTNEKSGEGNDSSASDVNIYLENRSVTIENALENKADALPSATDIPGVIMVRERVDIHGKVRPMEPASNIAALQMKPSEIGIIKEAPAMRWATGQDLWDKRYAKHADKAIEQQARYKKKADRLIREALTQGFVHRSHGTANESTSSPQNPPEENTPPRKVRKRTSLGRIQALRRWGPLDLEDENPPKSAIAARRDTPEAVALLKKSIYYTAPATHLTIPRLKPMHALRAAFDPHDDPNKPPPQSVSEQQVTAHFIPVHGLRVWDNLLRYVGRKSKAKAVDGIKSTVGELPTISKSGH
ncbi:alpha/beta-hydrolase [Agrocybe pediades]|nr:alpha/beta-hydrolase [Agrocybe pediades]